jgi:hypothetical protein
MYESMSLRDDECVSGAAPPHPFHADDGLRVWHIYWVNQIRVFQSWMLASNLIMDFRDVIPYRHCSRTVFYIPNKEILLLEVLRHSDPVQSLRSNKF